MTNKIYQTIKSVVQSFTRGAVITLGGILSLILLYLIFEYFVKNIVFFWIGAIIFAILSGIYGYLKDTKNKDKNTIKQINNDIGSFFKEIYESIIHNTASIIIIIISIIILYFGLAVFFRIFV